VSEMGDGISRIAPEHEAAGGDRFASLPLLHTLWSSAADNARHDAYRSPNHSAMQSIALYLLRILRPPPTNHSLHAGGDRDPCGCADHPIPRARTRDTSVCANRLRVGERIALPSILELFANELDAFELPFVAWGNTVRRFGIHDTTPIRPHLAARSESAPSQWLGAVSKERSG
jgi:hypothetical protein